MHSYSSLCGRAHYAWGEHAEGVGGTGSPQGAAQRPLGRGGRGLI